MLAKNKRLIESGGACHWLWPRKKNPRDKYWQNAPHYSYLDLQRSELSSSNIGVRLGEASKIGDLYLYAFDMDVRDANHAAECHAEMDKILPAWRTFPSVISGFGGESRHIYLLSDGLFRTTKIVANKEHCWAIDLRGTGGQIVLPPSIHPDTGRPYRWEREFDWDAIDGGYGHYVSGSAIVEATAARVVVKDDDDSDDLIGLVRSDPLDNLDGKSIRMHLESLSDFDWDDYKNWIDIGMGLHHQFQAGDEGFELWCEYSLRFPDKFDRRKARYFWDRFKFDKKDGLTFRTILHRAKLARDKRESEELTLLGGTDDDDEDLIGDIPLPLAPPEVTKDRAEPMEDWRSKLLDFAQEGGLKAHLHNLKAIIANDVRICGIVGYNQFAEKLRLIHEPKRIKKDERREKAPVQLVGWRWKVRDTVNGEPWSDSHDNAIRALIEAPKGQGGYGIKVSDRDLHAAIEQAATENAFHPVRDLLSSLTFDGTERVDTAFIRHLGCPDNVYYREISRLTFVAAVARIFEPGHKFDFAPIIEGLQGKRKSTFIRTLSLGWFNELGSDFSNDQRMVESMQGAWIVEIGELSGFKKHEVQIIKAWFSRQVDRVRMAYGRRVQEFPRQCIFIGSTNDKRYLRDDTGNRRFWPVEAVVGDIDIAKLEIELNQLWAEAVSIYRAMRAKQPHGDLPLYLKGEAAQIAGDMQDSRRVETSDDALMGQIVEWLDTPMKGDGMDGEGEEGQLRDRVCCVQIAVECLGMDRVSYSNNFSLPQKLSGIMARVPGWVTGSRGTRFTRYGKQRSFFRSPAN